MLKTQTVFFISVLIALTYQSSTSACECAVNPPGTVEARISSLSPETAVFAGRSLRVEVDDEGNQQVLFEVLDAWKGITTDRVSLVSGIKLCGFAFQQGREYFVIATPEDGKLVELPCSDTSLLRDAGPALRALGPPVNRAGEERCEQ